MGAAAKEVGQPILCGLDLSIHKCMEESECSETYLCICEHSPCDRVALQSCWGERHSFQPMILRKSCTCTSVKDIEPLPHIIYKKSIPGGSKN